MGQNDQPLQNSGLSIHILNDPGSLGHQLCYFGTGCTDGPNLSNSDERDTIMRGTGIFLAIGLVGGFFVGNYIGYAVLGSLAGMVIGVVIAALANRLLNRNR
jgi:membrane associated rhomboid family serine protease